jgi:hypothetical protein
VVRLGYADWAIDLQCNDCEAMGADRSAAPTPPHRDRRPLHAEAEVTCCGWGAGHSGCGVHVPASDGPLTVLFGEGDGFDDLISTAAD